VVVRCCLSSRLFVCLLPSHIGNLFFFFFQFLLSLLFERLPRKWEEILVEKRKFVVAGFSSLILGLIVLATELDKGGKKTKVGTF